MEEKSIYKNIVFNVLYRMINIIFPLITSVYISHILMAGGVGKVSTAQNIVQYFVLLAPLGLANYGTREIAKVRNESSLTRKLFSELVCVNSISTMCCSIVYYGMIFTIEWFSSERVLFVVAGLPIIFNVLNIEWYYQGHEEYVYIAMRSVWVKFFSLIGMIIFVRTSSDYVIYALIYALGIAGNYIFNVINLFRKGIRLQLSELKLIKHCKSLLILLCSNITIELYTLLDTTMLSVRCSEEIVGYYTNAVRLTKIIVGLITAIGTILLPRLSYYIKNGLKKECNELVSTVTLAMFYLAVPCGLGIFILADKIVYVLFGESFMPAVITVRIATILVYVLGFSNLFGTQVLLSFNQEKKLLVCTSVGAISNICMNVVLIPMFQQNGAIVASVISEILVTSMTIVFAYKYIHLKINVLDMIKIITAGICMCVGVILICMFISGNFSCLMSSVLGGALIYFLLSRLFKILPFMTLWKRLLKKHN